MRTQGDEGSVVERECLLFEAGEYPDRGASVTEADLDAIAANSALEIPVRIEHLRESPFDGALGVVTRLRREGGKLLGTLRQPMEAWRFVRRAGARALSVALDLERKLLVEVSFVSRPRVATAQVFGEGGRLIAEQGIEFDDEERGRSGGLSIQKFAQGLIAYLRGYAGEGEPPGPASESEESLRRELEETRIAHRIEEFKRRGLLRTTDEAEAAFRALLQASSGSVATFQGDSSPVGQIAERLLELNGPVVPMGEWVPGAPGSGLDPGAQLSALARERMRREGTSFHAALTEEGRRNPALARAARG